MNLFFSPDLEKGLKKRVKLHSYENGENGQNNGRAGENGQNGEIDSDDNYAEVGSMLIGYLFGQC